MNNIYSPGIYRVMDANGALVVEGAYTEYAEAMRSTQARNYLGRIDGQSNTSYQIFKKNDNGDWDYITVVYKSN